MRAVSPSDTCELGNSQMQICRSLLTFLGVCSVERDLTRIVLRSMVYGNHYAEKQPLRIGSRSKSLLNRRLYRKIGEYGSPGPKRVLEIGAGHGFFAEACTGHGDRYIGIEPNPVTFEQLHDRGFEVLQDSCPPIPFGDQEFDVVYAGYVFEYLESPPVALELLMEMKRVLKPGGQVAIVSSDFMRMKKEFWNVSYMTSFVTSERRFKQLAYDAGLIHRECLHFAGNLFGPTRYLAYLFYSFYSYRFLDALFGQHSKLDSRFYKLRVTFPEGVLYLAENPGVDKDSEE